MSINPIFSLLRQFLKTRVGRVLSHSGFMAALLGIITFLLVPFSHEPYLLEFERSMSLSESPFTRYTYYADLNCDGIQDKFLFENGTGVNAQVLVYATEETVEDQWNFLGSLNKETIGHFVGNYDKDSSMEIACFSVKANYIYLNIIEPYGNNTHLVKDRLVDTIWSTEANLSIVVSSAEFCDLNSDGFDELLFGLSSGRSNQPRGIYAYDIRADSIWRSPFSGSIYHHPMVVDYDHDNRMEIFCENRASGNYIKGGIAYPDTASWYVVLDNRLRYKVPPIPTGGVFSQTIPLFIEKDGGHNLYILTIDEQNPSSYCRWNLVNPDLTLTPVNIFPDHPGLRISTDIVKSSSGKVQQLPDPYHKKRYIISNCVVSDSIIHGYAKGQVRIFNYRAGIPEFEYAVVIEGVKEHIIFLDSQGKTLGKLPLETVDENYRISWMGISDGNQHLLVSGKKWDFLVAIRHNPWQYMQYLILLAMIGGFYGFIALIRFIQSQQMARQESMKKEVLELQLKAVRNQLDPHFTFNALNALSALSMTGDTKGVDQFIGFFSRLLRTHLKTSDQVLVSLRDEIEFVVNYVELQRIRFGNSFSLELDIPKNVDLGRKVPKMIVQTHVENAIKHGLRRKEDFGRQMVDGINEKEKLKVDIGVVKIQISEMDQSVSIVIEDNGVGRGNSTVSPFESTGKGLKALDRIISSVKLLYKMEIIQMTEDLKDEEGKPTGTRVIITIF